MHYKIFTCEWHSHPKTIVYSSKWIAFMYPQSVVLPRIINEHHLSKSNN